MAVCDVSRKNVRETEEPAPGLPELSNPPLQQSPRVTYPVKEGRGEYLGIDRSPSMTEIGLEHTKVTENRSAQRGLDGVTLRGLWLGPIRP